MVGADLLRRHAELELDAASSQLLRRVLVRFVGERRKHCVAEVDEHDAPLRERRVLVDVRHHVVRELGERAGSLDARRAPADHDERERALVDQVRVLVRVAIELEHARTDPLGVLERVERERVLGSAGSSEEVRLRPGCEHDDVAGERAAVVERERPGLGVGADDLSRSDLDVARVFEDLLEVEPDVRGGQLRRCHLVEQRLELVVSRSCRRR